MVNIKIIKQAVSIVLTSTLFITTILPISNVYATDLPSLGTVEGESNGSSERLGPTYNTEFNVGELGADSVRDTWINPSLNENQRPAPNSAIIST